MSQLWAWKQKNSEVQDIYKQAIWYALCTRDRFNCFDGLERSFVAFVFIIWWWNIPKKKLIFLLLLQFLYPPSLPSFCTCSYCYPADFYSIFFPLQKLYDLININMTSVIMVSVHSRPCNMLLACMQQAHAIVEERKLIQASDIFYTLFVRSSKK